MKQHRKYAIAAAILAIWGISGIIRPAQSFDPPEGWLTNLEEARALSKKTNRPVLAMVSADWCKPCQTMRKYVFPVDVVKNELKSWVPVYIDQDFQTEAAMSLSVFALPTFVMISPAGKEIDRYLGGSSEQVFLKTLEGVRTLPKLELETKVRPDDLELLKRLNDLYAAQATAEGDDRIKAGRLAKSTKAYDRVVAVYQERLLAKPEDAALWKGLAETYSNRADLTSIVEFKDAQKLVQDAVKCLEKAMAADPENKSGAADFHYLLKALPPVTMDIAESGKLLTAFESMFPKSPLLAEVIFYRASIAMQLNERAMAIVLLRDGIARFPKSEFVKDMKDMLEVLDGGGE